MITNLDFIEAAVAVILLLGGCMVIARALILPASYKMNEMKREELRKKKLEQERISEQAAQQKAEVEEAEKAEN